MPIPDSATCYRAVASRDARFDGYFFTAVRTTGIYCRPSCPAPTPKPANVEFLPTQAAAQVRGYRPCRRCRPEFAVGSPQWNVAGDTAARAMRLIEQGVMDREGVTGLAQRLGYSPRSVGRLLRAELGASPVMLARAQRASTARTLLASTTLSITDIAFAAGFSSVRQFNDTMQQLFGLTPTQLRLSHAPQGAARSGAGNGTGPVTLTLRFRAPMDAAATVGFLAARTIDGVEACAAGRYVRSLALPTGPGVVDILTAPQVPSRAAATGISCTLRLMSLRDLPAAIGRVRALLDLDADPCAVDTALQALEPLAPLVARHPGLRSPGAADGYEMALRAVVGQQISVRAARGVLAGMVAQWGTRLPPALTPDADALLSRVTHLFADPAELAARGPQEFPMPRRRGQSIVTLSQQVAAGDLWLGAGAHREHTVAALLALPGIGPWTAGYISMRALADPDIFLAGDLVARRAAASLGVTAAHIAAAAPWRSYLTHHLWRWATSS